MAVETVPSVTGVLAGAGKDTVRLVMHERPIPLEAPPEFASNAVAVIGPSDEIVDWRYQPDPGSTPEHRARFRQWRAKYVAEWIVGDLASIGAFLDWAQDRTDVSKLQFLRHSQTRLTINAMSRATWQLQEVGRLEALKREFGLGVFDGGHKYPLRGFVTGAEPVCILADREVSATATTGGLILRQRTGADLTVLGWRRDPSGVTALTPDGEESLGAGAAARLLTMIAPAAVDVRVAAFPLRTLFAELLVHLPEAARLAADCHAQLYCVSGQPKDRPSAATAAG